MDEKHMKSLAESLREHMNQCRLGMIGGMPQPYGILIYELEKKVVSEISQTGKDAESLEQLRLEVLEELRMHEERNLARPGHNNPPPYDPDVVARLEARVRELADAGGAWLDLGHIETEGQAGKLNDFLTQNRVAYKEIEDARKAAKEPHLEASKAVDTKFKALAAPLERLGTAIKGMLSVYLDIKRQEEERRKDAEREAARKQQEEADRLRREAEARNDVIAQAEAEEAAKQAAKAAKAAEKPARVNIASATGGGRTVSQRVSLEAQIADDSSARRSFGWLLADPISREPLIAELERLATAARRRKDGPTEIPGVSFIEKRSVA